MASDDTGHDWGSDGTAQVHRFLKVEALSAWLYNHAVPPDVVAHLLARRDVKTLNRICKLAGVNPPSKGSPTWAMTIEELRAPGTHILTRRGVRPHAPRFPYPAFLPPKETVTDDRPDTYSRAGAVAAGVRPGQPSDLHVPEPERGRHL